MKKQISVFTLLLALCMALGAARLTSPYAQVFRLHVVANSDSAADQVVKLAVRNAVLQAEAEAMKHARNAREARAVLMADGARIQKAAEDTLLQWGEDYGAALYVGRYAFPRRQYGDKTYPAGEYGALRVVLGEGRGQNWWCVMFPPLCILELSDGESKPEEEAPEMRSLILDWLKGVEKEWKKQEEK